MESSHPEWHKENSLTSPEDRDRVNKWRPEQAPSLTESQTVDALKELNNTSFTDKFPRVDRTYADPSLPMQYIGLISFTPAKGATPNENGVFGFAKLRGNFASEIDANQRAEYLIRNVDSHHQIYHTYVGRPFPITTSSQYSAKTEEVDIRKEMTKTISENVRSKKEDDEKTMKDMLEREEKLKEDVKKEEVDPYDEYITLQVKKAQLSWTYLEHKKKMDEIREIIIKSREQLKNMDSEFPEFRDKYFEKYMKARKDAGIKDLKEDQLNDSFMKFMLEDAILPGIDDVETTEGGVEESKE
jgi:hypothetical protein